MISTKRSHFVYGAAATLGVAAFVRAPARAAQYTYKLGHPDPVDYPPGVRMVQFAKAVKDETGGRMEIQVYPNAQLGTGASMLTQVRLGSLQFLFNNHSVYSAIAPVANIDSIGFVFTTQAQGLAALDGPLGAYVRRELGTKGLYVFEKSSASGFRQMCAWSKPIRTAEDFVGFKIRTIPSAIFVDLFKTLGASVVPLDASEMYTGIQTHLVDGAEDPLGVIESYRLYEVVKYVSITNHIWGGYWLSANTDAWKALPSDIQAVIERNASKYIMAERKDIAEINDSVADKLRRQGLIFNNADTATMRARLGPYYAHWKSEFGATAWGLLEATVGKLGA